MPEESAINIPGAPAGEQPAVVEPTTPREPLPLNVLGRTRADTVAVPHDVLPADALALAPLLDCE